MQRTLIIIAFFVIMAGSALAQEGRVTVNKDPKIDALIARRLELLQETSKVTSSQGYRVQIYAGLDRQQAYQVQMEFKSVYPEIRTYISYVQPNYRLRVGDFSTRQEADRFLNELRKSYSSLFIFSEKINLN